ncbi:MAG: aminoacyl-tRNA hydrolase [Candidatus Omnitrophica bacterium CG12_big_fil_rev_8_21_14_0_65_43_15]|uniref:Peptidyl-tRNA hydrolase n=1 Tax=Candidatus Taenaricola geysiri TaxID=1974752 RepID=A0A2J0LLF7_9BACT|nr:MAG: aminoacyl-tRNA hydrolase [Candidatus Omnitrophica bacterium CG1_02_43_210]PIR66028.1 MAG: aminoacyl-tRNA hydrolase [Candidatus Omnitrophica bacterium CG10_big_fil_rev_8_21_14_0_10_43_8]PIV11715.1 MAG: aminoacyl-tRNA hydrolase [Candidatus Omnitrophica bacterium CG03_land_8_20_14_0_80_43_22]PIW66890.1 MAG: aminoacyl-tRNA hydrolase [Candidatus Omnitrophica bacterium CG12_big_fil_rev_8_21_14_0_65_43_15]PIW80629.1 MAG: aminoacyl-tRNA hydrolase [Candidatus Omnitrophica bacterium CG_4_8_14_3_u
MKLIIGLGNPGLKYRNTRHNIGFKVVKLLAKNHDIKINRNEFGSKTGSGLIAGCKVIIAMPQLFMNLSGGPVRSLVDYHKIKNEDMFVICDDVNLSAGLLRIKPQGSAGGHNGLKSIIASIATDSFSRLRIGVGREGLKGNITNYVLGKFTAQEQKILPDILSQAAKVCESWIEHKTEKTANKFNRKVC